MNPQGAPVQLPGIASILGETDAQQAPSPQNSEPASESSEVPVADIRGALEVALTSDLDFKGTYYYEAAHTPAVNPILCLRNVGHIGLPLTEPAARRIISHCRQVPFGQGERTVADTAVRDTWEMDAVDVQFGNPAWGDFMDGVVKSACTALGVDVGLSKPRCELYKMLLYEAGSHFLPHKDAEKQAGMFATIIIILQSPYTGGEAHLSHGGQSVVVDHSQSSFFSTSVIACYTDVTHEIKPITGGYRLALSYNLVHTTTTIRPSIPGSDRAIQAFRDIFQSWKDQGYSGLQKVIYLLDHRYSHANFHGGTLKGSDSHRIALIAEIANECGFEVGIATVESHISGAPPGRADRRDRDPYDDGYGYSDEDEEEDDVGSSDITMDEVFSTEWSMTNLVDLDGNEIVDELYCDDDADETIPVDLQDQVESGPVDEEEYEGYRGNGAGTLDRWYRRTVLVIWPSFRDQEILKGEQYPQYVIDSLMNAKADDSDDQDEHLVASLFALFEAGRLTKSQVVKAVCTAACSWEVEELWQRGAELIDSSSPIEELGVPGILNSVRTFNLEVVLPKVALMLSNDPSNVARCRLLNELESSDSKDKDCLTPWIIDQRSFVMRTLKPMVPLDAPLVMDLAIKCGGIVCVKDILYPQIKTAKNTNVWFSFAKSFHAHQDKFNHESISIKDLVTDLLSLALAKAKYYDAQPPAKPTPAHGYHQNRQPPDPSSDRAFLHIRVCVETHNEKLVETIVNKLVTVEGVPIDAWKRADLVLLPLIPRLVKIAQGKPALVSDLRKLCQAAVTDALSRSPQQKISQKDLDRILDVVSTVDSGPELLKTLIVPKLVSDATDLGTFLDLARQLRAREAAFTFAAESDTSVRSLVEDIAKSMLRRINPILLSSPEVISYLAFLHEINQQSHCAAILLVLIEEKSLTNDYIATRLVPLIGDLCTFLGQKGIGTSSQPYSDFLKIAFCAWCRKVLGPRPPDVTAQVANMAKSLSSCCPSCKSIGTFLQTSNQPAMHLYAVGAPKAKHLESKMKAWCTPNIATWSITMSSPRGFQVTKGNAALNTARWNERAAQGKALLARIGQAEGTLRAIFGDRDYARVLRSMGQTVPPHILASIAKPPAAPSSGPLQQPQGTAGPSRVVAPTAAVPPAVQTPRRESISHTAPATKRRKVDDKNVMFIDLTTP